MRPMDVQFLSDRDGLLHTAARGDEIYDMVRCWQLTADVPVVMVPTEALVPRLEFVSWDSLEEEGRRGNAFELGHEDFHWKRMMEVDLTAPLMVRYEPDIDVLDGYHRIMRAWLEGDVEDLPTRDASDALDQCGFPRDAANMMFALRGYATA